MIKYKFDLLHCNITGFREKDHIILATCLTDAVQKFIRKHELDAPAYWDEPTFDRFIELTFVSAYGTVTYVISW